MTQRGSAAKQFEKRIREIYIKFPSSKILCTSRHTNGIHKSSVLEISIYISVQLIRCRQTQ